MAQILRNEALLALWNHGGQEMEECAGYYRRVLFCPVQHFVEKCLFLSWYACQDCGLKEPIKIRNWIKWNLRREKEL